VNEDLRALYVISVAAELAGVHPQTLRVYERKGLVGPSRTGGGSRRYSPADIEKLKRIGDLTASGLNLEGVRRVLDLEAELEALHEELARVRRETREQIERIHRQYRRELVPLPQAAMLLRRRTSSGFSRRVADESLVSPSESATSATARSARATSATATRSANRTRGEDSTANAN
jgi:MerR family transcriptional regulator, heat shock protein HspR